MKRRAFVAGSIAAAGAIRGTARAQTAALRVVTFPIALGALPYFAQQKGYFKDQGLTVDLTTMNAGPSALAALAGGSVDIVLASPGSIAGGVLRGLPFTVIADGSLYDAKRPNAFLCVSPGSSIAKAADLSGKTVAINGLKQIAQASTCRWLDLNGGKSGDVKFVEWPISEMVAGIESGRFDAAIVSEPDLTEAGPKLKRVSAPSNTVAPLFSVTSCACTTAWLGANREVARRFRLAMERTAAWANENARDAAVELAGFSQIPASLTAVMTPTLYPTSLRPASLQPAVDVMAQYGYIARRIDVTTFVMPA